MRCSATLRFGDAEIGLRGERKRELRTSPPAALARRRRAGHAAVRQSLAQQGHMRAHHLRSLDAVVPQDRGMVATPTNGLNRSASRQAQILADVV